MDAKRKGPSYPHHVGPGPNNLPINTFPLQLLARRSEAHLTLKPTSARVGKGNVSGNGGPGWLGQGKGDNLVNPLRGHKKANTLLDGASRHREVYLVKEGLYLITSGWYFLEISTNVVPQ